MRYRYPEGVPLARYFQDFGAAPGEMHRLSRSFMPSDESRRRPDWIGIIEAGIRDYLPPGLEITRKAFESLIEEAKRLTRDEADYCRTHGDFGDGNFAIDYDSGEVLEADEELDDGDS